MKRIPDHIKNSPLEPIWRRVETIGRSQGARPERGPIAFKPSGPEERRKIDQLVYASGAKIHERGDGVLEVTLVYDGEGEDEGVVTTSTAVEKPDPYA